MRFVDSARAAELLKEGSLVILPTETVYGLGANALNERAVEEIYRVKNRPVINPIICHCADSEAVFRLSQANPIAEKLSRFWPGPLTILLPHNGNIPLIVSAGSPLAGFRVPDHPAILEVLKNINFPVCAPSANLSGQRSPTDASMAVRQLEGRVNYIVDGGRCRVGIESTVVKIDGEKISILRHGAITSEMLTQAGFTIAEPAVTGRIESPGNLAAHYRPRLPLALLGSNEIPGHTAEERRSEKTGVVFPDSSIHELSIFALTFQGNATAGAKLMFDLGSSLEEAAANLYASFETADHSSCEIILATEFQDSGFGRALNDRLRRAASYRGRISGDKLILTESAPSLSS